MKGISRIVKASWLKGPAASDPKSGVVFVNPALMSRLSPKQRLFILLHEQGHLILNTRNELAADEYASRLFLRNGHDPDEAVKALELLPMTSQEHFNRIRQQKKRGMKDITDSFNYMKGLDPFLGMGKKARAKRAANKAKRDARKDKKVESKAIARMNRSGREQSGLGSFMNSAQGIVGSIFGGGGGSDTGGGDSGGDNGGAAVIKRDNTTTIIIVVVVVLIVAGVAIYFSQKKGK